MPYTLTASAMATTASLTKKPRDQLRAWDVSPTPVRRPDGVRGGASSGISTWVPWWDMVLLEAAGTAG
ncbi:hypothetical protein CELD12_13700 [Cellulomonas sp. NTE-D12]|nr:hypothetical protein CELD12_13700 [Cellulomonas sp. NTE-D12]